MSKQKLTPWFPGHIKPARKGVYERRRFAPKHGPSKSDEVDRVRWIKGSWRYMENNWRSLYQPYIDEGSDFQWRGLAADPKAKK